LRAFFQWGPHIGLVHDGEEAALQVGAAGFERADHAARMNRNDAVGNTSHLIEMMAGDENRAALGSEAADEVAYEDDAPRV
jgi:hypothetical protein